MLIDHKNKAVIATPAKTGTASLETIARGYRNEPVPEGLELVYWPDGQKKPHTMVFPDHLRTPGGRSIKDYTRYMVVRRPHERLVSLYQWLTLDYHIPGEWPERADDLRNMKDFHEFVAWWARQRNEYGYNEAITDLEFDDPSFWMHPHCWMVTYVECAKQFRPDRLLRLENFEDDLKMVRDDWGRIPRRHKGKREEDWRHFYSQADRKLVYGILADDLGMWMRGEV